MYKNSHLSIQTTFRKNIDFHFWVPLLTHYRFDEKEIVLDVERMFQHTQQILPHTNLWMLGGTTGDGWALTDKLFNEVLDLMYEKRFQDLGARCLIGALRPTTEAVLERIDLIKTHFGCGERASCVENAAFLERAGVVGVTVCPPIGAGQSQQQIFDHFYTICQKAAVPIVIYQLPQVTHNQIEPETAQRLVETCPEVVMIKDSSGADTLAHSCLFRDSVLLLRGAEGDYTEVLKLNGGDYDGWLLSTGNSFSRQLKTIIGMSQRNEQEAARTESDQLSRAVWAIFSIVREWSSENLFSNANKAIDHLMAYGKHWKMFDRPCLIDHSSLPDSIFEKIEHVLASVGWLPEKGYLSG